MRGTDLRVTAAQLADETRRTLDVREQEGDGPAGELLTGWHSRPVSHVVPRKTTRRAPPRPVGEREPGVARKRRGGFAPAPLLHDLPSCQHAFSGLQTCL